MSLPVSRPIGRALIVGSPSCRSQPLLTLQRHGFHCAQVDDPYSAMAELCRRPLVYRALILSLQSLYREELSLVATIKRRFPHIEIWLTQTDGRQAALAEAMRQGADGLLDEEGLHRTATGAPNIELATPQRAETTPPPPVEPDSSDLTDDPPLGEPILSSEELRALLQEQPSLPPTGNHES
ncbi:MAG: hypothetical protein IT447_16340 [Phycisphaerales bacterium]|nr:hypothetical protein [Phycisphaerales bacterium]